MCLFLKASAAACAHEESAIKATLEGLCFGFEVVEWISRDDFVQQVTGRKFDIVYLGAHANGQGFGETTNAEHDGMSLEMRFAGRTVWFPKAHFSSAVAEVE